MVEYGLIRAIQGDLVISPTLPRLAVRVDPNLIYLGDLEYIRRETYHVEEFVYINPNSVGHVTELLLIHFEGFLENQPGAFRYPNAQSVEIDGDLYEYETFSVDIQEYITRQNDSIIARAADYIRQRAYTLAGTLTFQHFRRAVSIDQRNEFSILYGFLTAETQAEPQERPAGADQPEPTPPAEETPPVEKALAHFSIIR